MPKRGASRASLDAPPATTTPAKKACPATLTHDELLAKALAEPERGTFDYRAQAFWRYAPKGAQAAKMVSPLLKKCLQIVKSIMKKKGGVYFCYPVDPVELGIPDYYDVVDRPMDLGTVQAWIESGYYDRSVGPVPAHLQCAQDVELVFNNAAAYNPEGTEVHTFAVKLLAEWHQLFAKVEEEARATEAAEAAAAAKKAERARAGAVAKPGVNGGGEGSTQKPGVNGGAEGATQDNSGQFTPKNWGCHSGVRSPGDGSQIFQIVYY